MPAGNATNKNWSETTVFPLEKYSRANTRPSESTSRSQTASQSSNSFDWSHFTQPKLSLLVETAHGDSETANKSGNLSLNRHQKIILRVMWDSNPQSEKGNSIIKSGTSDSLSVFQLEKINLTEVQESFGHLRMGEIPLKANCKDRVIAIRYATGQTAGSLIFSRIQIKLQNLVDCFKFIAIIETICPCKMGSHTTSTINTQDSRKTASPFSGNIINLSDSHKSSQPPVEVNKNKKTSTELTKLTPILETENCDAPDLTSFSASYLGHETVKSPILSQNKNRAAASDILPATINELNNLSDEILTDYVREIAMEPGFDSLVKHVRRLLPQQ